MKIEIKIVSEPDVQGKPKTDANKQSVSVETHNRRDETFTVQKVDAVDEGDGMVFVVPLGGRLMITTPQTDEALVYDRDQSATVRSSLQGNDENKADSAAPEPSPRKPSVELPKTSAPRPQMNAPVANTAKAPPKPGEAGSNKPDPITGKMHPEDVAKQQQSMSGRPPGEKAPLPGSPVGSPPAGNEGKDNK